MENINPWPLLRARKAEQRQGLALARQEFAKDPDASQIMQLGVALLWLEEYAEAWGHFRRSLENFPIKGDAFYGMAGVAKWCLGKPDEAVAEWRAGLKAKYARASGLGVRMPLLLFFAAMRQPEVFDRQLAEELLRKKTADRRIGNWPGPIAKLVLDQIGEAEFGNACRGIEPGDAGINPFNRQDARETQDCLWLAAFYRSVLGFEPGALANFQDSMRNLSDTSQPEWQEHKVFRHRLWHEEFFIARYEAGIHKRGAH